MIGRVHELANRTATKDDLEAQTRGGTCGGTSGFELQSELESVVTKNSVDAFVYERAERHARFCFDGNKQSRDLHRSVDTSSFFADRVAANAICTYVYRLPDHVETTRGNAVVAAIVAHSTGRGGDCDAPGAGDYLRTIGTALRLPQIRHTARFTSNAPVTVRTDYGRLFDQAIVQYTPNTGLTLFV